MGKHSRDHNDPVQRGAQFDEMYNTHAKAGREKEEQRQRDRYRVVDGPSQSGGCAFIGAGLFTGLGVLGYLAARFKGLA